MKKLLSVSVAAVFAVASAMAIASSAGGHGGDHGGSGGGGQSGGHASSQGLAHTNGPEATDREFGLARAAEVANQNGLVNGIQKSTTPGSDSDGTPPTTTSATL